MSDDKILGKRQADSSGWDAGHDLKRIHRENSLADQETATHQSVDSRVLPSLSDLFGSPSPWPTIGHSKIDSLPHQGFMESLSYTGFFDEAQQHRDSSSDLLYGYSNQLEAYNPAFPGQFSTQIEPPSVHCVLDPLEDPMQYNFTNDSISCNLNASFQSIGGQTTEFDQFFNVPSFQPISTSFVEVATVNDLQTLTPHYPASTLAVKEPDRSGIRTSPCPESAEESSDIKTGSEGETTIDTCFGVIITTPTCFASGNERMSSVAARLDSCGTFLKIHDEATDKYLGLLNMPTLCELMDSVSIRLKAHMSPVEEPAPPGKPKKSKGAVSGSTSEYNLRIVIEGSKEDGQAVGRLLSGADLFLQHPSASERDPALEYFNPQYLVLPGGSMPNLEDLVIEDDDQKLRSKQLDDTAKARLLRLFDDANVTVGNAISDISPSPRLKTPLMPHQLKALSMMVERESGVIESEQFPLLWDMGLGKSLSLLALICSSLDHHQKTDPKEMASSTLIVAPKSVISAWETQSIRHIHNGRVRLLLYHGANRSQHGGTFEGFDIVLTTYDTLRSECTLNGPLYSHAWLRLALDEAHHIRNRQSQIFQACCNVQARYRWCLTGTPVQNSLDDYGSLLSFLKVDPFQDKSEFDRWIAKPFYKNDTLSLDRLRCLILSTCFRRTKATVNLSNPLPERSDIIQDVRLFPSDQKMYDFFKKIIQDKVTGASTNRHASRGQTTKHGDVLAYITTLRRICDHSQLLSPKAIETWRRGDWDDAGNTTILDSTTYCDVCGEEYDDLTSPSSSQGSCKACLAQENHGSAIYTSNDANVPASAKIEALVANIQQHKTGFQGQRPPKSVVFSAWTKMLDLTQQALQSRGFSCQRIDGQTSLQGRSNAMKAFDEDDECTVMLATIGSAGEGTVRASPGAPLEPNGRSASGGQSTPDRPDETSHSHQYIQWVQQDKMRTINMSLDTISDADKAEEKRWERLKKYLQ
ncbi:hypothetical protein PG985_016293 [Apiospora marii]|uniref:uncharacterized protein n=1 Tax=Apiospora marii TaxID=335849 RepID=UPI00312F1BFC